MSKNKNYKALKIEIDCNRYGINRVDRRINNIYFWIFMLVVCAVIGLIFFVVNNQEIEDIKENMLRKECHIEESVEKVIVSRNWEYIKECRETNYIYNNELEDISCEDNIKITHLDTLKSIWFDNCEPIEKICMVKTTEEVCEFI